MIFWRKLGEILSEISETKYNKRFKADSQRLAVLV